MNQDQVRHLLQFADRSFPDRTREALFRQLGYECFHCRNLGQWIGQYTEDVQSFLDWVNVQHGSRYWERIEFVDEDTLVLTGRVVQGCACAFADCDNPPTSLCHHCCKAFQEQIFTTLLGRDVDVTIDSGFLLGDERCSTTIRIRKSLGS